MSLLIGKTVEYYNVMQKQHCTGLILDRFIGVYNEKQNTDYSINHDNDIAIHYYMIKDDKTNHLRHILPEYIFKIIDTPTNTTP